MSNFFLAIISCVASVYFSGIGIVGIVKNSPFLVPARWPLMLLAPLFFIWGAIAVCPIIASCPGNGSSFDFYPFLVVFWVAYLVFTNKGGICAIGADGKLVLKAVKAALIGGNLKFDERPSGFLLINSNAFIHFECDLLGSWTIWATGPGRIGVMAIIEKGVGEFFVRHERGCVKFKFLKFLVYGLILFALGIIVILR